MQVSSRIINAVIVLITFCLSAFDPTGVAFGNSIDANPSPAKDGDLVPPKEPRAGLRPTAMDFGAKGDCATDDTAALQSLFTHGGFLPSAPGGCYKVTRTIYPAAGATVEGSGHQSAAVLRLLLPPNAPVVPVIQIKATAPNVTIENFAVDGGFNPGSSKPALNPPRIYGGKIIAGSAILVAGSHTSVHRLTVDNAWDNGISIGDLDDQNNHPSAVIVDGISCNKNGYGSLGGACIDNAGGTNSIISNSIDIGSETSFIIDIGAGAHNVMSDMTARGSVNLGFYIGAAQLVISNLKSEFSGGLGFWFDAANQNQVDDHGRKTSTSQVVATGLMSYSSQKQGFLIKTGQLSISNAMAIGASAAGAGRYPAWEVASSISLYDISLENCSSYGANTTYGYIETPSNKASINVKLVGDRFAGGTADFKPDTPSGGTVLSGQGLLTPAPGGTTTRIGFLSSGTGYILQYAFDAAAVMQTAYGKTLQIAAYWGLEFHGGHQQALAPAPGTGSPSNSAAMFYGWSGDRRPNTTWYDYAGTTVLAQIPANGGIEIPKLSAAPMTAPGAGLVQIFAVAGTKSGSCKVQVIAGTSASPVTLVDNVGIGC